MQARFESYIDEFIMRAKEIRKTTNLNKVAASNDLRFRVREVSGVENSHKPQVELALVDSRGVAHAWLVVEPKRMSNGSLHTYFVLGKSSIRRKGYGEFLRALADKIGRNVGATATNQWAVNISGMGGKEPPSAGIMRKLGAKTYKSRSPGQAHGIHFRLKRTRSRANTILKQRFKLKIPNVPRTYQNQFRKLYEANIPNVLMNKNNAHNFILNHVKNSNMADSLNRAKRRITNKNISPVNLLKKYHEIFEARGASVNSRLNTLQKKTALQVAARKLKNVEFRKLKNAAEHLKIPQHLVNKIIANRQRKSMKARGLVNYSNL